MIICFFPRVRLPCLSYFFFLNDAPPTDFSPLPLHDALPISPRQHLVDHGGHRPDVGGGGGVVAVQLLPGHVQKRPDERAGGGERARVARVARDPEGRDEIGRAHGRTPVTLSSPMPASASKKK